MLKYTFPSSIYIIKPIYVDLHYRIGLINMPYSSALTQTFLNIFMNEFLIFNSIKNRHIDYFTYSIIIDYFTTAKLIQFCFATNFLEVHL